MKYVITVVIGLLLCTRAVVAGDDEMVPTIEVSASASFAKAPDLAVIQLSVETFAKTALEATQENARKMGQMSKQLKKQGLAPAQIRTTHFQVDPQYDYKDGRQKDPRPIGYKVHNTVEVDILDIKKVGQVIDGAIDAGANRIMGLAFKVRDSEGAYQMALTNAMKSAKKQAEAIAAGAGVKLGNLLWVSTSGRAPVPMYKNVRAEAMMAADTSISGGEVDIVANVRVKYHIKWK
ncbi:MAG: SIMPL domain-containing protein [Candidatus Latescibacteria bacterium]|jgi:uncharacterized protein|nr:SIMPL domain-containing protein [Candidatus Latescibacterota bacterium]MBT5832721.1 SIMPL domain-containing protein [Candidatus Latescibacterota bacterium]